jgi:hypothetical protein
VDCSAFPVRRTPNSNGPGIIERSVCAGGRGDVLCDPALPNCAMGLCKWTFKNCVGVFVAAALVIRLHPYPLGVNHATSKKITTYRILFLPSSEPIIRKFPTPPSCSFTRYWWRSIFIYKTYMSVHDAHLRKYCAWTESVQHITFPIRINLIRMS